MANFETDITTALILKILGHEPVKKDPGATGFFYDDGDDFYLVTNKHVVYKKTTKEDDFTEERLVDELFLYLDSNLALPKGRMHLQIPLKDVLQKKDGSRIDLILIPLGKDFWKHNKEIIPVNQSFLKEDPAPDAEIFTLGYPMSSELNNGVIMPVLAHGKLTDKCRTDRDGIFRFVGDIPTFPGMSGSPIFDKTGQNLIGVHSGRHNHQRGMSKINILVDQGANIWLAKLIPEIINDSKK
jgi:V8-like Glu-specific endopeptidase